MLLFALDLVAHIKMADGPTAQIARVKMADTEVSAFFITGIMTSVRVPMPVANVDVVRVEAGEGAQSVREGATQLIGKAHIDFATQSKAARAFEGFKEVGGFRAQGIGLGSETLEETAARGMPLQTASDTESKPPCVRDLWATAGGLTVINERENRSEEVGENGGIQVYNSHKKPLNLKPHCQQLMGAILPPKRG